MNDDELAAVIAAATARLRANDVPTPAPASIAPWQIAARLGPSAADDARVAPAGTSLWSLRGRARE